MVTAGGVARHYDWAKQVKEFEDTKAGVKGLADTGATKIPDFFVHPKESLNDPPQAPPTSAAREPLQLPCIDFQGVESAGGERRRKVVEEIRHAASTWGFFRMVNHGVPVDSMNAILEAVKRFHEQPTEAKKDLYSGDMSKKVRFTSNVPIREYDASCWRDILSCVFMDDTLDSQLIPETCRSEVLEYLSRMIKLREIMAELLSEALGLPSDYLSRIECAKSETIVLLYYPKCPEPDRTVGNAKHSDPTVFTLLLQDPKIGGLQVLHQDQWIDIPPVHGTLIANIGDFMQVISNDKFKSVEHRVLAQPIGPRVSVACFFSMSSKAGAEPFGPIKELTSEESPPVYKQFMVSDYMATYMMSYGLVTSTLPSYKL